MLKGMSVAATVVLAAAVLALFRFHALLARGPIGAALQAGAVVLLIWARLTFGVRSLHAAANPTAGGLMTSGPYRFIRHPIYAAVLLFVWSAALSHFSAATAAIGLVASGASAVRIAAEERLVAERYPEYREYARRTARLVPYLF